MQKIGRGGMLIITATILFIASLFLPWTKILNVRMSGFAQEGFYVLILYLYPVYTVLAKRKVQAFAGMLCAIIALVFLIYFLFYMSGNFMGTTFSTASLGLYLAIISALLLLIGVVYKAKQVD
ncbi:hypothetical protein DX933_13865 [Ornithinibacillus gellani]|uniref:hypothetical protein n=1 Tax=Ornithinibacillus gellani TaxID=2293253 RepID=UPI000F496866|nr:hypothetical protein [Ornithinibacillus gellani]TQS72071.1 hypothetical protein DX933_13865 [Ornithinibacillus gellani]